MQAEKLNDIISFAHQYVEEDRFAETLGRTLMTLDVDSDRNCILLLALAVVHADQYASAGKNETDQDVIDETIIDMMGVLPFDVRHRFVQAISHALDLHRAVVGVS